MDSLLQDLSAEGVEGVDVAVWDGPHVHEEPVFPLARGHFAHLGAHYHSPLEQARL